MRTDHVLEVVQLWGSSALSAETYDRDQRVTIGSASTAALTLPPHLILGEHTLASVVHGEWVVQLPPESHVTSHACDTRTFLLSCDATTTIELGDFAFLLRVTERSPKLKAAPLLRAREHAWFAVSFAVHLLFVLTALLAPPGADALVSELDQEAVRRYLPAHVDAFEVASASSTAESATEAASGAPGNEGVPTRSAPARRPSSRARAHDTADPSDAIGDPLPGMPILHALEHITSAFPTPAGNATGEAWNPNAYGDLAALTSGVGRGPGGFGMTRTPSRAWGGGGSGFGTTCAEYIPADPPRRMYASGCGIGELGVGVSVGVGYGLLAPMTGRGQRISHVPNNIRVCGGPDIHNPHPCDANVTGALSRNDIRRVVQRNLGQVRHCYEQALVTRGDLEGRVSMSFMISPTGAVQGATPADNTLGSEEVAACVSQTVTRWSFPAADAPTFVNYPFTFQPTQT